MSVMKPTIGNFIHSLTQSVRKNKGRVPSFSNKFGSDIILFLGFLFQAGGGVATLSEP